MKSNSTSAFAHIETPLVPSPCALCRLQRSLAEQQRAAEQLCSDNHELQESLAVATRALSDRRHLDDLVHGHLDAASQGERQSPPCEPCGPGGCSSSSSTYSASRSPRGDKIRAWPSRPVERSYARIGDLFPGEPARHGGPLTSAAHCPLARDGIAHNGSHLDVTSLGFANALLDMCDGLVRESASYRRRAQLDAHGTGLHNDVASSTPPPLHDRTPEMHRNVQYESSEIGSLVSLREATPARRRTGDPLQEVWRSSLRKNSKPKAWIMTIHNPAVAHTVCT